ncbi:3778_t:CDS:2, partial [Acaulospora colombiana]
FVKLEQIAKENAENAKLRDNELNDRIVELEQSAKESENRFVKLEQKQTQSKDDLASKLDQSKIKSPCPEPKLSTDQAQNDIPSQIAEASTLVKTPLNSITIKQISDVPVDIDLTPGSVPHLAHLFGKAEKTGRKEKLRWYYY